MGNIRFHYSSSKNITFNGVIETNIPAEEWAAMAEKDQENFLAEELFELVQIYAVEE